MAQLVYEATGNPVVIGQIVHIDGDPHIVHGFYPPHKPSSSGKVTVIDMLGGEHEYYVGVIGAHWINREDQPWN